MRRSYQFALSLGLVSVYVLVSATLVLAQSTWTPKLWTTEWPSTSETFRARGSDPVPPRTLELWCYRDEAFSLVATTRSLPGGRFDFGEIGVPNDLLLLSVTPQGVAPTLDTLLAIERRIAAPQIASLLAAHDLEVVVYPAHLEGELRIYDASDARLLSRLAIEPTRAPGLSFDPIDLFGTAMPEAILIRQVLEDGRVSDPAYFRFDAVVVVGDDEFGSASLE